MGRTNLHSVRIYITDEELKAWQAFMNPSPVSGYVRALVNQHIEEAKQAGIVTAFEKRA